VAYGSGVKVRSRAKRRIGMLQMRAIRRMIRAERRTVFKSLKVPFLLS
jgi:hypothetical protein